MAGKRYSPQAQRLGNGPGRGASRYHLRRWIYRARRLWPDQSDRREVRAFSLLPRAAAEREGDQWSPRALYLWRERSEEHTSELQSLMRTSYAVFCLKKNKTPNVKYHYD